VTRVTSRLHTDLTVTLTQLQTIFQHRIAVLFNYVVTQVDQSVHAVGCDELLHVASVESPNTTSDISVFNICRQSTPPPPPPLLLLLLL